MSDLLGYFVLGGALIAAVVVLYLPIFFLLRRRVSAVRQFCVLLLAGCDLVVLFATILSRMGGDAFHPIQHFINVIPFHWLLVPWAMGVRKMITQMVANVLLFVPIGFFLPVVFAGVRKLGRTILAVLLFSVAIEIFQYFIGASSDIDDVILNLLGGVLGYGVFRLFARRFRWDNWWRKALGAGGLRAGSRGGENAST